MRFVDLSKDEKRKIHLEVMDCVASIGGKNFFLQMKEDIRKESNHPLLNKSKAYNYSNGRYSWNKSIYRDTLNLLISTMKKEENDENFFKKLSPKESKVVLNMMRTLKPLQINVKPKNIKDGDGFTFSIVDTSNEESSKISLLFKVIFLYNIELVKKILNYEIEIEKVEKLEEATL
jgi:hypothetical protein